MKSFFYILSATLLLSFFSCQREINGFDNEEIPTDPAVPAPVQGSLTGLIVDDNNQPFPGVKIQTGSGNTAVTDSRGYFRFNNITLDKYNSVVSAEASGYFKGFRVFAASGKGTNFVKIKLLKKIVAGTINAVSGGGVTFGDNKISLPAAAVVYKSSGQPYTGSVTVFAQPINPLSPEIQDIIPGSFLAIDSLNTRRFLQSFGMMAVELEGSGGEPLQIAGGKAAQVEFGIPAALLAKAPASIPLWYVDETTGLWKQEGRANRSGNQFKGEVKHFSFWNCDISFLEVVTFISMKLQNSAGYPLPYIKTRITWDDLGDASIGYTDSTGFLIALAPKNYPLTLSVLDECNRVIYTRSLQAITDPIDLGTIIVNLNNYEVPVSGIVKTCSGTPVTNGWVNVSLDYKSYNLPIDNTGHFGVVLTSCNNGTITIIANDITNTQTSSPYYYTAHIDPANNLVLNACGNTLDLYDVTTYAGDGNQLFADGTGTAASFFAPTGICMDAAGNLYIGDNSKIRKISPARAVTTLAGDEFGGYQDGPVSAAKFKSVTGMAVDPSGNLILCDAANHCIRKLTPAGIVSTIAGDGSRGYGGYADGTGTAALFDFPADIVLDAAGNMYVADASNDKIRKITPAGVVTTFAGSTEGYADGPAGSAKFNDPVCLVFDAGGNLIVADGVNGRIRKITPAGMVSTLAGNGAVASIDGPALSASFQGLRKVAVDASGNIIAAENVRVRKLSVTGTVSTLAGNTGGYQDGPGNTAMFQGLWGMAMAPDRKIYVADVFNRRIRRLTPQ